MAAPKFKKNSVEQRINLKELFGVSFKNLPALREVIGQAIVDRIVDRTGEGKGMKFSGEKGTPFNLNSVPYSKAYLKSLDAKAHGKKKNPVDMRLSGDMLELLDIKSSKADEIVIGWNDTLENNKAFNHSIGDTVPQRPFFGVNKKELKTIRKEFNPDVKEALKIKEDDGTKAFNEFALGLLKGLRDGS